MRTVKAWIVDVFRTPWDWDDGDVAWTEVYETEEEALSAAKAVEGALIIGHAEVYEDEVDIWEDEDFFEKGVENAS